MSVEPTEAGDERPQHLARLQAQSELERGTSRDPDEVARTASRYLAERAPEGGDAATRERIRAGFRDAIDRAAAVELIDAGGGVERALPREVRELVDTTHPSDRRLLRHAANVAQGRVKPLREAVARDAYAVERQRRGPDVGYTR